MSRPIYAGARRASDKRLTRQKTSLAYEQHAPSMTTDTPAAKQRLRITFTRDETLKYIGHLDMARTWQRIARRANLPLAYSEGFNPQPRLSFAAALPVGCTSDHEELDMVLSPPCAIDEVKSAIGSSAAAGDEGHLDRGDAAERACPANAAGGDGV